MASVSKTIIVGNLGQEPKMTYFPDGTAVCNLSVATSETWRDKTSGEKKESTEWHKVVLYRALAEIAGKYLHQGSQIYIEGRNQTRSYEKDGQKFYVTEVIAKEMKMLGGKDRQNDEPQTEYGGGAADDSGIPF